MWGVDKIVGVIIFWEAKEGEVVTANYWQKINNSLIKKQGELLGGCDISAYQGRGAGQYLEATPSVLPTSSLPPCTNK